MLPLSSRQGPRPPQHGRVIFVGGGRPGWARQREVALIAAATKTETIGAEKGFVSPLDDAMRIRMGEYGTSVL